MPETMIVFIFASIMMLAFSVVPIVLLIIIWKIFIKNSNYKKTTEKPENVLINEIMQLDNTFNPQDFKENAKKCLLQVYSYISTQDIENLMSLESNALFNIHKKEIEIGRENNVINTKHFDSIGEIKITHHKIDGDKEIIGCGVWVTSRDITLDATTNQLQTYAEIGTMQKIYLEFMRSTNIKTVQGKDFALQKCPNCDATIEINAQGKCIYCNSLILNGEHSWVLNKISPFYLYM